jgi:mono/diheme cytochrome c family protein
MYHSMVKPSQFRHPVTCAGAAFGVLLCAAVAAAQDSLPPARSTMHGVYNAEQATRGADTWASVCAACHAIGEVTGLNFSKKWVGYPLWDLYSYLKESMPQDNPGGLTDREYAQVVAWLLKQNNMPEGKDELPPDTLTLRRIKVDTLKVDTLRRGIIRPARR